MKCKASNKSSKIKSKDIWRNPIYFLAFGFGLGLFPCMPGTIGTLGVIPLFLLLSDLNILMYLLICILLFVLGIYVCQITEKDSGIKDNPQIVWDEIVGFLFALCLVPDQLNWYIFAFIIFRLIDIFKPWPITLIEKRTSGGFSIMADDLLAGLFTMIIVWLTSLLIL